MAYMFTASGKTSVDRGAREWAARLTKHLEKLTERPVTLLFPATGPLFEFIIAARFESLADIDAFLNASQADPGYQELTGEWRAKGYVTDLAYRIYIIAN